MDSWRGTMRGWIDTGLHGNASLLQAFPMRQVFLYVNSRCGKLRRRADACRIVPFSSGIRSKGYIRPTVSIISGTMYRSKKSPSSSSGRGLVSNPASHHVHNDIKISRVCPRAKYCIVHEHCCRFLLCHISSGLGNSCLSVSTGFSS